jgi:hypothetical protein
LSEPDRRAQGTDVPSVNSTLSRSRPRSVTRRVTRVPPAANRRDRAVHASALLEDLVRPPRNFIVNRIPRARLHVRNQPFQFSRSIKRHVTVWQVRRGGLPDVLPVRARASRRSAVSFLSSRTVLAKITTQRIRRGSFENVRAQETAIESYLTNHNQYCKPFVWTVTDDAILDKVKRFCERTSDTRHEQDCKRPKSQGLFPCVLYLFWT